MNITEDKANISSSFQFELHVYLAKREKKIEKIISF